MDLTYTGITRLDIPFAVPSKNLKEIMNSNLDIKVNRLSIPMASAINIHYLLVKNFFKKYPLITPTKQPRGSIPLIRDNVSVLCNSVMFLK